MKKHSVPVAIEEEPKKIRAVRERKPKPVIQAPAPQIDIEALFARLDARRPVEPPPPSPPNPNIMAMESEIMEFVKARSAAQQSIARATQNLEQAQHILHGCQAEFQRIDGDIQYRMSLLNQMRGGAPVSLPPPPPPPPAFMQQGYNIGQAATSPTYAPAQPYPTMPPPFGFAGSIPADNRGLHPDFHADPEGAMTESADLIRREEMRTRGY